MKLKILVTGKNKKVAYDVAAHLEDDRGYITVKSPAKKGPLYDVILAELPKVTIICLGDETVETIRAYNVLWEVSKHGRCYVIVITNEEDEKLFMRYTNLNKVLFISRPVSLFALYEKLSDIEEELEKNKEKAESLFREFENDHVTDEHHRKQILVVDDDAEQLVIIKEQLEEFYDVTLVKSGEAAFKYLLKHTPDLILLDYLMPGDDGPQVLRKMRTVDDYAKIPVMFLTGMTEKEAVLNTLIELKPQGYIIKPAKKSELVAKIIEIVG